MEKNLNHSWRAAAYEKPKVEVEGAPKLQGFTSEKKSHPINYNTTMSTSSKMCYVGGHQALYYCL